MRFISPALAVLLLLLNGILALHPLAGQAPKPARVDSYGDPLPDGAIARLGTLRLVHLGELSSVAISRDGKVVASGVRTGKDVYPGEIVALENGDFTIEQKERFTLATIRLWDADTGKRLREIVTPDAPVSVLQFDQAGRFLYAGCGRFLWCFETATGKKLWQVESVKGANFERSLVTWQIVIAKDKLISIHRGELTCEVKSKGGASYYRHSQYVLRYWDSKTGKPLPLPEPLQSSIQAETRIPVLFHEAVVSADGRFAAVLVTHQAEPLLEVGYHDSNWKYKGRTLQIVDLEQGKVIHSIPDAKDTLYRVTVLEEGRSWQTLRALNLTLADDGQSLAMLGDDGLVLLRTSDGKKRMLAVPKDAWVSQMTFIDKTLLAAKLNQDSIHVWDISSGKPVEKHTINESHFEPARAGSRVATRHGDTVSILDLHSGKPLHAFSGHRMTPAIRYAIHSSNILVSSDLESANYWNAKNWSLKSQLALCGEFSRYWYYVRDMLGVEMDSTTAVEKQIYAKEADYHLELRDVKTDKLLRSLQHCTDNPGTARFSPSGNRLFTRDAEFIHFFDVASGEHLSRISREESRWLGFHKTAVLSQHGKYFATNSEISSIDLFDVDSGKFVRSVGPEVDDKNGKGGSVLAFRFTPDEQMVFGEVHRRLDRENGFESERVSVQLWDVASGKIIKDLIIDPAYTVFWREALIRRATGTLALSHDRRFLALTHRRENTIEIWEVASGAKRGVLPGHDGRIADLAFSPDGRQLASSSEDTTILIWDLNRPLQPGKFANRLGADELAAHWKSLYQGDAMAADTAIWSLVNAPADSVPYLQKRLPPAVRPDAKHVQSLLRGLDSGDFRVRTKAEVELESLGELILVELEEAFKQKNAVEKQRRLEVLVAKAHKAARPFETPERVGQWRVLEVLERIGTADALQMLRDLAGGAPSAQLTIAARGVLARMKAK